MPSPHPADRHHQPAKTVGPDPGFCLFDTSIGRCAIAWNRAGVLRVALPGATDAQTGERAITQHLPGAVASDPPASIQRAIASITLHLAGGRADLSRIRLDLDGLPPFSRQVYEAARAIPSGSTISYGELAERLGRPGAARAVGQALGRNPFPVVVPCHRVLAAGGRIGGFSAGGGVETKRRMLALEGVIRTGAAGHEVPSHRLPFDPRQAVRHLRSADADLARLIAAVGPCTMELRDASSAFAALAEAIVHQQLSPKAAETIHARLRALLDGGDSGSEPERVLALPDEALRAVGLSGAKTRAIQDLARRVLDGNVPTLHQAAQMSDDAIIEALSEVRGVGRWTAEMFLIFRLGRPDVLPLGDYGVRRGFALAFDRASTPDPAELSARAEAWRPYRTVASWYLWRALDSGTR